MSRLLPPAFFTSRKIYLPCEMIRHVGSFLEFKDYRSFIRATYPNGEGEQLFQEDLWKASTKKFEAKFLDYRPLEIVYNYDPERKMADWILVKVESLLPILRDIKAPTNDEFVSIYKTETILKTGVNLNVSTCSLRPYQQNFGTDRIIHGYYQHYCWKHITRWLRYYLLPVILLRESREHYVELISTKHYIKGGDRLLQSTGEHEDAAFWFQFAKTKGRLIMINVNQPIVLF